MQVRITVHACMVMCFFGSSLLNAIAYVYGCTAGPGLRCYRKLLARSLFISNQEMERLRRQLAAVINHKSFPAFARYHSLVSPSPLPSWSRSRHWSASFSNLDLLQPGFDTLKICRLSPIPCLMPKLLTSLLKRLVVHLQIGLPLRRDGSDCRSLGFTLSFGLL